MAIKNDFNVEVVENNTKYFNSQEELDDLNIKEQHENISI